MIQTIEALRRDAAAREHIRQARYFVSIAPTDRNTWSYRSSAAIAGVPDGGIDLVYSSDTLRRANLAIVTEVLLTGSGELLSNMEIYRWDHGHWSSQFDLWREKHPEEWKRAQQTVEQWRAKIGRAPATSNSAVRDSND